ncbi:Transcription repressor OFP6 [Glycine soja]|uniref:Transcription repressor n=1 Tax=Glycine soja TaxID=3848 RepID=A0A445IJI0_GLYSO|nr:Transcription repressor OFP6 [Glycine soja]
MSSSRKKLVLNTVSVSLGCGSCRRPRLLRHIFHPKQRPKKPAGQVHGLHWDDTTTSSTTTNASTAATFSPCYAEASAQFSDFAETAKAFGRGVAVEKDSDDPYLDFRHSMLQMILENEIYSKEDLRELLNCFLQLNSPDHHGVIVRAFTEIWNGVFSVRRRSGSSTGFHLNPNPLRLATREFRFWRRDLVKNGCQLSRFSLWVATAEELCPCSPNEYGTWLYEKYIDTLLIATTQDAANHIFLIAYAIVKGETTSARGFFLKNLIVVNIRMNRGVVEKKWWPAL